MRAVADRFPAARLLRERSGRTVWFRDSPRGRRRRRSRSSRRSRSPAAPIACRSSTCLARPSMARRSAPGRSSRWATSDRGSAPAAQSLAIPPVLDLIDHCERERFDRVLVSGLGPMAAAARCAAFCLELELVAIVTVAAYDRLAAAVDGARARVGAGELPAVALRSGSRDPGHRRRCSRPARARLHSRAPRATGASSRPRRNRWR